jgi:hypothetical protein
VNLLPPVKEQMSSITSSLLSNATEVAVNTLIDDIEKHLEALRATPVWAAAILIIVICVLCVLILQVAVCVLSAPLFLAVSRWRNIHAPHHEHIPFTSDINESDNSKLDVEAIPSKTRSGRKGHRSRDTADIAADTPL